LFVEKKIQIIDLPELDEIDLARVESTIDKSYDRTANFAGEEHLLVVHFKQHKNAGMRTKHSVHTRLSSSKLNVKAEANSWNVITSLQEALRELEREARELSDKKKKH